MYFDPANIQQMGIAISAFLITLMAVFLLVFAYNDKTARAMLYAFLAASVWAWFGFFYHIVGDLELAREIRVISVAGIVGLTGLFMNYAFVYAAESRRLAELEQAIRGILLVAGGGLLLILGRDLFDGRLIVGNLTEPANVVLAPEAGPYLPLVIGYHAVTMGVMVYLLFYRMRTAAPGSEKRQARILFWALTVAIALGFPRYTPWYGFDFLPLLGGLAAPLLVISAFYAIKNYRLFNIPVAAAELLVFTIWAFTFFRAVLNPSVTDALPDVLPFVATLVLGLFLIRTVLREQRLEGEVRALMVERAKTEFATIAAHQLRTPAAGLRWLFDALAKGEAGELSAAQRDIVEKGMRAAKNLTELISEFLNVVKVSDGKLAYVFERGDVGDILRDALVSLRGEIEDRRTTVSLDIAPEVPRISADKKKLELAFQNVIDNAVKYSPPGGAIEITVRSRGSSIEVAVQDHGIGIGPDERTRLFEKFFRSPEAAKMYTDGSGLGLLIAKTVLEGHGGSIGVHSAGLGSGTTVTITLPVQ